MSVDGGAAADTGGTEEADLDAEQAMTQAPDASVASYEGPNTVQGSYDVWNTIVSADVAQVISTSWGMCEPDAETSARKVGAYTALFERASAQGQWDFSRRPGTQVRRTASRRMIRRPSRSTIRRRTLGSPRSAVLPCTAAPMRWHGTGAALSSVPRRMVAKGRLVAGCRATSPA